MSDINTEAQNEQKQRGKKSDSDLMKIYEQTGTDSLSEAEISRVNMLIDLRASDATRKLRLREVQDGERKDAAQRDKFTSRGRELKSVQLSQEKHQAGCSHRKGGRGLEGLQRGGDRPEFALIRHLLPWNEWYIRCQRCGKTFKPPHIADYDLTNADSKAAFDKAKEEYQWAMSAPTDNTPSSGITFTWDDGGKFAHENIKDVNLR